MTDTNRLFSTDISFCFEEEDEVEVVGLITFMFIFNAKELKVRISRRSCASLRKEENISSVETLVPIESDTFGRIEVGYFSNI